MNCLPEIRGTGVAHKLITIALGYAKKYYNKFYLETLENMIAAQKFYEKHGFKRIYEPVVKTEHFACDVLYIKELKKKDKIYYTYMLRCEDNSIYTGITTDINRRMEEHFSKNKKCAKYTLNHVAKKVESVWQTENRALASKLEYHIKKLTKQCKEELILNNNLEELLADKIDASNYKKL